MRDNGRQFPAGDAVIAPALAVACRPRFAQNPSGMMIANSKVADLQNGLAAAVKLFRTSLPTVRSNS